MPGPLPDNSHLRDEHDRRFEAVQATFDYLSTDWNAFWQAGAVDLLRDYETPLAIRAFLQAMLAWNEEFEYNDQLNYARRTIEELRSELRIAARNEEYITARVADLVDTVRFFQESIDRFMSALSTCSVYDLEPFPLTFDRQDDDFDLGDHYPLGYRRVPPPSEQDNDLEGSDLGDTAAHPLSESQENFIRTLQPALPRRIDQGDAQDKEEDIEDGEREAISACENSHDGKKIDCEDTPNGKRN